MKTFNLNKLPDDYYTIIINTEHANVCGDVYVGVDNSLITYPCRGHVTIFRKSCTY